MRDDQFITETNSLDVKWDRKKARQNVEGNIHHTHTHTIEGRHILCFHISS